MHMRLRFILGATALCVPLTGLTQQSTPPQIIEEHHGNVTNLSVVGQLAPTRELDCIDLEQVQRSFTPPDLHTAVRKCIAASDFDRALQLFMMAGVYASFDAARVADVSARDAGQMLAFRFAQFTTPDQKTQFAKALRPLTKATPELATLCERIAKVGPPDYVPTYMILHGAGYLARRLNHLPEPAEGPLVPDFDPVTTWARVQKTYLHCA